MQKFTLCTIWNYCDIRAGAAAAFQGDFGSLRSGFECDLRSIFGSVLGSSRFSDLWRQQNRSAPSLIRGLGGKWASSASGAASVNSAQNRFLFLGFLATLASKADLAWR